MFVQYYDIVGDEELPNDKVEKLLDCMRLKWELHWEDEERREKGKGFAFCRLDSIRVRVKIVQTNALVELLYETVPYKVAIFQHL